jgi:hypothetical protein
MLPDDNAHVAWAAALRATDDGPELTEDADDASATGRCSARDRAMPEAWVTCIAMLRGNDFDDELAAFRERHPDYELSDDLRTRMR